MYMVNMKHRTRQGQSSPQHLLILSNKIIEGGTMQTKNSSTKNRTKQAFLRLRNLFQKKKRHIYSSLQEHHGAQGNEAMKTTTVSYMFGAQGVAIERRR